MYALNFLYEFNLFSIHLPMFSRITSLIILKFIPRTFPNTFNSITTNDPSYQIKYQLIAQQKLFYFCYIFLFGVKLSFICRKKLIDIIVFINKDI